MAAQTQVWEITVPQEDLDAIFFVLFFKDGVLLDLPHNLEISKIINRNLKM